MHVLGYLNLFVVHSNFICELPMHALTLLFMKINKIVQKDAMLSSPNWNHGNYFRSGALDTVTVLSLLLWTWIHSGLPFSGVFH
jgi:hypothetical protein